MPFRSLSRRLNPFTLAWAYLVLGGVWIWVSDRYLIGWVESWWGGELLWLQTAKGWIYMVLTAGLLYVLVRQMSRRLEASARDYRRMFEENPHPMWFYERENLRFLAVNEAAIAQYGYSREEFLRMTIRDIRPQAEIPRLEAELERPKSGYHHAGHWRHLTKDQREIWVNLSSSETVFAGRPAKLVLAQDISEQVAHEEEIEQLNVDLAQEVRLRNQEIADKEAVLLSQDQERLNLILQNVREVVWSGVIEEQLTEYLSPSVKALLGYEPKHFLQGDIHFQDLLLPEYQEAYQAVVEALIRTGEGQLECQLRTRSGEKRWVKARVWLREVSPDGKRRSDAILTDITLQKEAELRQKRETKRLRLAHTSFLAVVQRPEFVDGQLEVVVPMLKDAAKECLEVSGSHYWYMECESQRLTDFDDSQPLAPENLPDGEDFGAYLQTLAQTRIVEIAATPALDGWKRPWQAYMQEQGYAMLTHVPIWSEGRVSGIFALGRSGTPQPWSPLEIKLAEEMADLISQTIANQKRRQAEYNQMKALVKGADQERERVAADLHDGLGQSVALASLQLASLKDRLVYPSPKEKEAFLKAEGMVNLALEEIRNISSDLEPRILQNFGLLAAIRPLLAHFEELSGVKTEFFCNQLEARFHPDVRTNLYRIVQEALNNVYKHAQATHLSVQLMCHPGQLILTIEDDGKGFNKQEALSKERLGLQNMQNRVTTLEGRFTVDTSPGKGTSLLIEIPLS